tara:strand:+ start:307 stop:672 length:366 start_codon:yes stop_codon:yes gene_type:complete
VIKAELNRQVNAGAAAVTKPFKDNKIHTPRGSTLEAYNRLKIASQKAGHHLTGSEYPEQYGTQKSLINETDPEAALASSRANYLRKGQYAKTDKKHDRRSLDNFDTGTLLTPGQKAKKLPA